MWVNGLELEVGDLISYEVQGKYNEAIIVLIRPTGTPIVARETGWLARERTHRELDAVGYKGSATEFWYIHPESHPRLLRKAMLRDQISLMLLKEF